jgi:hypothetical protein
MSDPQEKNKYGLPTTENGLIDQPAWLLEAMSDPQEKNKHGLPTTKNGLIDHPAWLLEGLGTVSSRRPETPESMAATDWLKLMGAATGASLTNAKDRIIGRYSGEGPQLSAQEWNMGTNGGRMLAQARATRFLIEERVTTEKTIKEMREYVDTCDMIREEEWEGRDRPPTTKERQARIGRNSAEKKREQRAQKALAKQSSSGAQSQDLSVEPGQFNKMRNFIHSTMREGSKIRDLCTEYEQAFSKEPRLADQIKAESRRTVWNHPLNKWQSLSRFIGTKPQTSKGESSTAHTDMPKIGNSKVATRRFQSVLGHAASEVARSYFPSASPELEDAMLISNEWQKYEGGKLRISTLADSQWVTGTEREDTASFVLHTTDKDGKIISSAPIKPLELAAIFDEL